MFKMFQTKKIQKKIFLRNRYLLLTNFLIPGSDRFYQLFIFFPTTQPCASCVASSSNRARDACGFSCSATTRKEKIFINCVPRKRPSRSLKHYTLCLKMQCLLSFSIFSSSKFEPLVRVCFLLLSSFSSYQILNHYFVLQMLHSESLTFTTVVNSIIFL